MDKLFVAERVFNKKNSSTNTIISLKFEEKWAKNAKNAIFAEKF